MPPNPVSYHWLAAVNDDHSSTVGLKLLFPKQHPPNLGEFLDMSILSPTTDLLNQNLWRWNPSYRVLTSPPGDSNTGQTLRTAIRSLEPCVERDLGERTLRIKGPPS